MTKTAKTENITLLPYAERVAKAKDKRARKEEMRARLAARSAASLAPKE